MVQYLKRRMFEWILVTCSSLGLIHPILAGFVLKDSFYNGPVFLTIIVFILSLVLLISVYNRKTRIIGIIAAILLLILFFLYVQSVHPFSDESGNSIGISVVITVIVTLLVFLASRSRAGTVILFLLGNLVIAASAFLQFPVKSFSYILFLFATGMLYFNLVYHVTLLHVSMGRVRLKRFIFQSLSICITAMLVGIGVYVFVIQTIQPPTKELHLITKLQKMEMLQVLGVSNTVEVVNSSLKSNQLNDDIEYGKNPGKQKNDTEENSDSIPNDNDDELKKTEDKDKTSEEIDEKKSSDAYAVWYDLSTTTKNITVILILLLVIMLPIIKINSRKRWKKNVEQLERDSQILNYYSFFIKRLIHCGYRKEKHLTLDEYSSQILNAMDIFRVGNVDFSKLTEIYERVLYGGNSVTQDECQMFQDFYHMFYKNLKREMGTMRYFMKWFLL